jgi:cytochrome b subunit of formate dehydrogenase
MKGFNFRAYLRNYDIIQAIGTNKTRKQFKNFLRVMYGKKKDRGRIKKKIEKYIQEQNKDRAKLYNAISKVMPHLSIMGQSFYW